MTENDFKGGIHAVMGGILSVMCGYNLMRWCATGRARFKLNVSVYVPLMLFEGYQTWFHWSLGRNTETPPDELKSKVELP